MKNNHNHNNFIFWSCLISAMALPFIASLFYFVLFSDNLLGTGIYSFTKIFSLVWPIFCTILIFKKPLSIKNALKLPTLKDGVTGLGVGILFMVGIVLLLKTPVGNLVWAAAPQIKAKAEGLGLARHFWLFAIFLSLAHSLIEEYYWRWFVYGNLREKLPMAGAHGLAGISFAAHHVVVTTQFFPFFWGLLFGLAVGVGGVIWSLMFEKQKTLWGAWISHALADMAIMGIGAKIILG